ncbi:hypothetical protein OEA41_006355 [Lepraria neglecta]|uniref:F-box domain-containing protein n=1 Tax=Lepraria neglecta TaxID=209136 RepID=A0AAD9ZA63_9LECA|nr:hypothetical protein OEA41_006355 [Lepraria neglecta]
MSRLLTTSNEALLQIFEEVVHKDLENFTLSCKRIHVIICGHKKEAKKGTEFHPTLLLRDVLTDKNIALYVKIFCLRRLSTVGEQITDEVHRVFDDQSGAIRAEIQQNLYTGGKSAEVWVKGVLLLCLLPNLQSFSLECSLRNSKIDALSKLNKASFKNGDCRYFLPFAALPSLRSLRGVSIQKYFWDNEPLVYGSNITSLIFEQSLLDSESINNVIKNTFDLEHLKFSFDGMESNATEEITHEIVDCLLRRAQNTLRSLDIPGDICAGEIAWDFEEEESVHNLTEFERLEIIRVGNTIFTELVDEDEDEDEEDDYDHGENKKANEDESGNHVQGLTRWTRPLVECSPRSVVSLSLTLPVRKGEASQLLEGWLDGERNIPRRRLPSRTATI